MTLADVLVLLGAGMFVLGYLIINQVILRVMLLIGTALYVSYYAVVDETPLWSAIWASSATGAANMLGLLGLLYRNSRFAIPRKHLDIYDRFSVLPPGDFRKLMQHATRATRPAGHPLTSQGQRPEKLHFIISGQIEIEKFGGRFQLPDGIFVGEVAYLNYSGASATTRLAVESDILEWDVATLRKRSAQNPRFRLALDALISVDLAGKVARAGAPDAQRGGTSPTQQPT